MIFKQIKAEDLLSEHKRASFQKEDKVFPNLYPIYMYSEFIASIYKVKADRTNMRKIHIHNHDWQF